jgi:hypothetical protein
METKPDELEYETLQSKRWNGIMYDGMNPSQNTLMSQPSPYYQHRTEKYGFSEATALYCGVMQIVFGLCLIAVGLGCFFLNTCMSIICLGIWGGVFFIIAGLLGILTVYRGGRKYVIATIVFCFLSAMIAAAAIVLGGIAVVLDFADEDSTILCPRIIPVSPKAVRGKIAMDILYIVFAACEILITIVQSLNCYSRNVTLHKMGCPHCKHCHTLKMLLEKKRHKTTRNITVPKSRANVYVVPEPTESEIIKTTKVPTPVKSPPAPAPAPIHIEETKDVRSEPEQGQGWQNPRKGQLILDEKTINSLKKNKQQVLVLPIIVPMKEVNLQPPGYQNQKRVYQDETLQRRPVSPIEQEPQHSQPHHQEPEEHIYQNTQKKQHSPSPSPEHVPIFWGQQITLDQPIDPDKPITAETLPLDRMIQAEQQLAYADPKKRSPPVPPPVPTKPLVKKQAVTKRRDTPYWGAHMPQQEGYPSEHEEQEQSLDITDGRSSESFDAKL